MKLTYYSYGNRTDNKIALTFDDGPNPIFTEKVLEILRKSGVKSTFFLLGKFASSYPQIVKKIFSEGYLIGNHTYNHKRNDFKRCDKIVKDIIGIKTNFLRAPYLDLNFFIGLNRQYLNRVKIVNFDVDSFDWRGIQSEKVISRVKKLVRNGSIINFHDGSENKAELKNRPVQMIKALPVLISNLKKRYQLVKLDELELLPLEKTLGIRDDKIVPRYPNVTQKVFFRCKNKVLIMRHPNGILDFPGGRIEFRESLFGALHREINEEMDYDLEKMPELFDTWNYISHDRSRHSVMIYYIYDFKKMLHFISPEGLEFLWLTKKDMLDINLMENPIFVDKIFDYKIKD